MKSLLNVFNNYSQNDELVKELKRIKEKLKTTDKSDDSEIKKISEYIIDLEIAVKESYNEAKVLSQKILNYLTNNLDEIHKTYNDHKYTKILKDLNKSQSFIFDNLEEFDNHDQVIIRSCFDNIYLYIIEVCLK